MILHLFKNDLRRSRILLGIWTLLVVVQSLLVGWGAHPGDQLLQGAYLSIAKLVPVFQSLLLIVIIPHLIQEEPLVGTTAFWFTRPILRSDLLQAKMLFAVILISLPLLTEVCVLAANGVTAHDIALAVPEIVLLQFSCVIAAAVIATITPNFGRFAIVGAAAAVLSILASVAIRYLIMFRQPEAMMADYANFALTKSRTIAYNLCMVAGGGACVVHQYFTRKTARTVAGAVAVAVLSIAIHGFWPWTILRHDTAAAPGPRFDPASVSIRLSRSTTQDVGSIRGLGTQKKTIVATLVTEGLPAGDVVTARHITPVLRLPDGSAVATQEAEKVQSWGPPGSIGPALQSAFGGIPVVNASDGSGFLATLFRINADAFRKYADQPLDLTVNLDMVVSKYRIVAELPIVRGARYDGGSEHQVISDVLHDGTGVDIMVEQRTVQLLFDGMHRPAAMAMLTDADGETVYVLCNRKRREVVLEKHDIGFDLDLMLSMDQRLIHRTQKLSFGPEPFRLTPDLTDEWLADATLVRLELVPVGTLDGHLEVARFKLNGPNRSAVRTEGVKDYDPEELAGVFLPDRPNPAQAREFVESLLARSQRRVYVGPLTKNLCRIGHANIRVLFDEADTATAGGLNVALEKAIEELALPEDKNMILEALPNNPLLVGLVVKYGWTAEARGTLLAALTDKSQRNLPRDWIRAVVSLRDPATYDDLKAYLVRCRRKLETYLAIRALPGMNLTDATIDLAWKNAKLGSQLDVLGGAGMAAEFGHPDALAELIKIMNNDENGDGAIRRAVQLFRRFTPASGNAAALTTWYEANQDHLAFDPVKKKFLVQSP